MLEKPRAINDPSSAVLGFGGIMMEKHKDGDALGISFARGDDRLFTIWFANSKGADALANNVNIARRILERAENGDPEKVWCVIQEIKDTGHA